MLQSPLAGVSDQIFRGFIRRWAPEALLFTEMVNATSLDLGHKSNKIDELTLEKGPIGVQLFDHRPEAMAEAAAEEGEEGEEGASDEGEVSTDDGETPAEDSE